MSDGDSVKALMFGFVFGKIDDVVPLSMSEGVLTFICSTRYKAGKSLKAKLLKAGEEAFEGPTVPLVVATVEPLADGGFQCSGVVDISEQKLPALLLEMAAMGIEGASRRASRRVSSSVRILSRELPNFRAVTRDISATGAQLYCDGAVIPGSYLNLKLDLEMVGFPELTVQVVSVWCAEELDGRVAKSRVGVALTPQHPQTHAAWEKYYNHLLAKEGSSVMLRTMDGGEDATPSGAQRRIAAPPPPPLPPQAPPPPVVQASVPSAVYGAREGQPQAHARLSLPPSPQPASPSVGFGWAPPQSQPSHLASQPPGQPANFNFPPSQPPGQPMGFNFPSSQAPAQPFNFPPSQAPGAPAGYNFPASPVPVQATGLSPPFGQSALPPYNIQPLTAPHSGSGSRSLEPVEPLGIKGPNLAFQGKNDFSYQAGQRRPVLLAFEVQGRPMQLPVNVEISRVELMPDGSCVCWCIVLEDAEKIGVLNRVLD